MNRQKVLGILGTATLTLTTSTTALLLIVAKALGLDDMNFIHKRSNIIQQMIRREGILPDLGMDDAGPIGSVLHLPSVPLAWIRWHRVGQWY